MNTRSSHRHGRLAGLIALALVPALGIAQQAAPAQPTPAPAGNNINREASFPAIESGKWTGRRLPDGQPDIQGSWSNTIGNHNNFTDPQGGTAGGGNRGANARPLGPRNERAPSRVSDPPDGQLPLQPWAEAKVKEFQANFHNPTRPEYVEPLARCAPGGVPKSLYWHGYEIRQYPGYVLFLFDSGTRIIHLDGKPHLPDNIKLWNADSRGRWEGNTLVVEVANNNGKALFGRSGEFASENVRVTERYVFSGDGKRFNYVATFTDPGVYTRPFTVTIPARRWTEADAPNGWQYIVHAANRPGKPVLHERPEQICSENNGGFGGPAQAARR